MLWCVVRHEDASGTEGKRLQHCGQTSSFVWCETWATTRGQKARLGVNKMRMLTWMCGVTRRDMIRNEHIRWTTRVVQASKKITERLKWYGQVRGMKQENNYSAKYARRGVTRENNKREAKSKMERWV